MTKNYVQDMNPTTKTEIEACRDKIIERAKRAEIEALREINVLLSQVNKVIESKGSELDMYLDLRRELQRICKHDGAKKEVEIDRGYYADSCTICGKIGSVKGGYTTAQDLNSGGFVWFRSFHKEVEQNNIEINEVKGDYC